MNNTATYTPLESLLLFQSLVAFGTDQNAFIKISDLLTSNALVRSGDTYDPARLRSDTLCDLYLQLLRNELKSESEQDALEDGAQPASKKRKLQSPPLPSLKDAEAYKENLPLLVERLYARYRDYMVSAIREDERRYTKVEKEIADIERVEWNAPIRPEKRNKVVQNGGLLPEEPTLSKVNGTGINPTQSALQDTRPVAVGPPREQPRPQPQQVKEHAVATKIPKPPITSPPSKVNPEGLAIKNIPNNYQPPPAPSPRAQQNSQNGPQHIPPPVASQRPEKTATPVPAPLQSTPLQPPTAWRWEPPYQAGPSLQPNPYQMSASYPLPSPQFSPHSFAPPPRGSFPSPHGSHNLPPPPPHVPSSPHSHQQSQVLFPPPSTLRMSPNSSGMPLDALADIAGQQFRAPSSSPLIPYGQSPGSFASSFTTQQRPPSSNGPRHPPPPQWNQQYIPPSPAQSAPYNYPAPSPMPKPSYPTRPEFIAPENRQYNSPYNANQTPRPSYPQPQGLLDARPSVPSTPISQSLPKHITGTATKWTPTAVGSIPKSMKQLEPPPFEPLSPPLRPKTIPEKAGTKTPTQKPEQPKALKTQTRRGTQRTRAGSTASSVRGGSRRGQSVMSHTDDASHADELSMDNDTPMHRFVKQEVATPRSVDDTGNTTADEGPSRYSHTSLTSRYNNKRKRDPSIERRQPSGTPTRVQWTRAFPKISASALDTIAGHRNASTFALPIKEREAPGYKDWINRPQDLKSIRSAITAGHKAAAASAAANDLDKGQSSISLPISEDLVPPKGIINNAQLEKELMRMFANAIMFNADPDQGFGRDFFSKEYNEVKAKEGYELDENTVVKDTRAMFLDAEKVVAALRSAERRSEEVAMERDASAAISAGKLENEEVDESAGGEEGSGSVAKRRRKA